MSDLKAPESKKHIREISAEYHPFWHPLFKTMGISSPRFGAKLCYMGKEFGEKRVECVRFWPNELSSGKDFYVELFDWDQEHYDRKNRVLYRLVDNPNWKANPGKYVEVSTSYESPTYAVKISDLEIVNSTPVTAAYAEVISIPKPFRVEVPSEEEEFSGMFSEKEDCHISGMTMRDKYCMQHNVPLSNKEWLNDLIKQTIAWQQKTQA
jgi:hypothetical protein